MERRVVRVCSPHHMSHFSNKKIVTLRSSPHSKILVVLFLVDLAGKLNSIINQIRGAVTRLERKVEVQF